MIEIRLQADNPAGLLTAAKEIVSFLETPGRCFACAANITRAEREETKALDGQTAPAPEAPAPSAADIKDLVEAFINKYSVVKIKEVLLGFGVSRVSDIPAERLAEFTGRLKASFA